MENILYSNDFRHTKQNWSMKNRQRWKDFAKDRASGKETPFVAQTVIAASYGLMQVLYDTGVDRFRFLDGGVGRPPHFLFDPITSIDLGTEFDTRSFLRFFGSSFSANPTMATPAVMEATFFPAIQNYNPDEKGYGAIVLARSRQFLVIR